MCFICEDIGILIHQLVGMKHDATILEGKLVVLSQLKYAFILSGPVIDFLGLFPRENVTQVRKGTYIRMIIIALFLGTGSIWRSVLGK